MECFVISARSGVSGHLFLSLLEKLAQYAHLFHFILFTQKFIKQFVSKLNTYASIAIV